MMSKADASPTKPIRLGTLVLPSALSDMLNNGLSIPVYLEYQAQDTEIKSQQKIADAILYSQDGGLYIRALHLDETLQKTKLSDQTKQALDLIKDQKIDNALRFDVTEDAKLNLDLKSLYMTLVVDESALGTSYIPRAGILGASSSESLSSILNYRFGSYYNQYDDRSNASSYVNLDSVSSLKENHLILNASAYGLGTNDSSMEIYRALYERDVEGYRFAAGMMDAWSMQSIASINGVNSGKIYGMSYGNISNSALQNSALSLTPITVFLPSAGTVQLYREGRLLSIQNFPLGSHEVDTSSLPTGVYSVEVKTIINGEETNSTIAQVNKSYQRQSSDTEKLNWQVFGGKLEYTRLNNARLNNSGVNHRGDEQFRRGRDEDAWLAGAAVNKNYAWLAGVSLRSSVYGIADFDQSDNTLVTEIDGQVSLSQNFNLNLQTLLATDSTFRNILTANYGLPKGYGNIWGSREITHLGDNLSLEKRDYYNFGATFNLKQIYRKLGLINTNYSNDVQQKNKYFNLEYSQNLMNAKYADLGVRAGIQKNTYQNNDFNQTNNEDKYIYFDLRMPFAKWFSAGVSSRNDNVLASVSYRQNFQDHLVKNVGLELSKVVKQKEKTSDSNPVAVSGYVGYENKYNAGTLSASTEGSNYSVNYTSQGAIAFAGRQMVLSNNTLESGVIINTALKDQGKMSAIINGQTHQLSGMTNFIPLSPYTEYRIELANDRTSMDSVNIVKGRSSEVILYPGNVPVLNPEVQQMVTVFGRIHYPSGDVAKNVNINNHIGKTVTDENGEFSIDVDKRYPVLTLIEDNGALCESELNLKKADSAIWVGDIHCQMKGTSTSNKLLGATR